MRFLLFAIAAMALAGCQNTVEGAKEDTESNMEKAAGTANQAMDSIDHAGLTLKVKTAITADPDLNDSRNRIDVDAADGVLTLTGHVHSKELKERAESIAKKELGTEGDIKVDNKLDVQDGDAPGQL